MRIMTRKSTTFAALVATAIITLSAGCAVNTADSSRSGFVIGKAEKVSGILIHEVQKGGPADIAGIKSGDVIVSYDGKKIEDIEILNDEIESSPPGNKVTLEVMRNDSLINVGVTFKKTGWHIMNVDPASEFPNYSVNIFKNILWIGTYPYPVEPTLEEMLFRPYHIFDADHIPVTPPTFFSISVR